MTCREIEAEGVAERYLLGQLPEAAAVAYEEHFFACAPCYAHLQLLQAMQKELREAPHGRTAPSWWKWAGVAAALFIALAIFWRGGHPASAPAIVARHQPARPSYDVIARFDPPPYRASTLRGNDGAGSFRAAMRFYTEHDYASALQALSPLPETDPGVLFYRGICQLLESQPEAAAASLARVAGLGDTLYLEPARFYRAKALLRLGDGPAAATELEAVIALQGNLEPQAGQVLEQLRAIEAAAK